MAKISNKEFWKNIAESIKGHYGKRKGDLQHQFFDHYGATEDNPLLSVTNAWHATFFGPKVCNIFIVGKPYGESGSGNNTSIDWPPDGYDYAKEQFKIAYDKNYWVHYELNFYLDLTIVKKARAADPRSADKLQDLLEQVFDNIRKDCEGEGEGEGEMADYGWKIRMTFGEDETPRPDDFYPVLDAFYKKKNEDQSMNL